MVFSSSAAVLSSKSSSLSLAVAVSALIDFTASQKYAVMPSGGSWDAHKVSSAVPV